jgi:hypothetical protein
LSARDHLDDYESNLRVDDALSAQAEYRSYRQPEKGILSLFEKWWKKHHGHGSALRVGLDYHEGAKKSAKDLASIAMLEKTWTHRFIDNRDYLRKRFAKAGVLSSCSTYYPDYLTPNSLANISRE